MGRPLHVCPACGTLNEPAQLHIANLEHRLEQLQEDYMNMERDLASKRRTIKRMRAEQTLAFRNSSRYDEALEVLEHWKKVCAPTAREVTSPPRLEACIARLNGDYTVAQLKRACEGYALKPYVVNGRRTHEGPKDQWRADAELIFRSAKNVDQGLRIADRADDLRQVLAAPQNAQEAPLVQAAPVSLSPLGEQALRLAGYGFLVFPCRPGEKAPATSNGLHAAKRDPELIRGWWQRNPQHNVAIRTGAESGIFVLDVDGEAGWDSLHRLEDENDELPRTASVTTPSGGQHFYFQHPGWEIRNTAGFPADNLDLRGDGGYVLAVGSIGKDGRRYEVDEQAPIAPAPPWLLDKIRAYQNRVQSVLNGSMDWAAFITEGANQGQRNQRMTQFVGHLFNRCHDANEVFALARVLNSSLKPPLPEKELGTIVKSIARAQARSAA